MKLGVPTKDRQAFEPLFFFAPQAASAISAGVASPMAGQSSEAAFFSNRHWIAAYLDKFAQLKALGVVVNQVAGDRLSRTGRLRIVRASA
jgi:hypothetical protein